MLSQQVSTFGAIRMFQIIFSIRNARLTGMAVFVKTAISLAVKNSHWDGCFLKTA